LPPVFVGVDILQTEMYSSIKRSQDHHHKGGPEMPSLDKLREDLQDAEDALRRSNGKDDFARLDVDWLREKIRCQETIEMFTDEDDNADV